MIIRIGCELEVQSLLIVCVSSQAITRLGPGLHKSALASYNNTLPVVLVQLFIFFAVLRSNHTT